MQAVIDAVIPTFRPDGKLFSILSMLETQSVPLRRIRIINTEENGLRRLLEENRQTTQSFLAQHGTVELTHIGAPDFDHGGTRDLGMKQCEGAAYVLFLTQDAVPADTFLVERLLKPFGADALTAVSYARQLPARDASEAEKFSRAFNYPEKSRVKTKADTPELGIKTYFCSNVCALYDTKIYARQGPFASPVIFNEDMIYAGRAVQAGFHIAYAADAEVVHSHNYSAQQQLRRNFDLGVSQADHPEIFGSVSSEGEGVRYVRAAVGHLFRHGAAAEVPGFILTCGARFIGYRLGKNYRRLSAGRIAKLTSNPAYWEHAGRPETD